MGFWSTTRSNAMTFKTGLHVQVISKLPVITLVFFTHVDTYLPAVLLKLM